MLLNYAFRNLEVNLFIVEKVLGEHMQRMLEISRCLHTGGNLKLNVGKNSLEN